MRWHGDGHSWPWLASVGHGLVQDWPRAGMMLAIEVLRGHMDLADGRKHLLAAEWHCGCHRRRVVMPLAMRCPMRLARRCPMRLAATEAPGGVWPPAALANRDGRLLAKAGLCGDSPAVRCVDAGATDLEGPWPRMWPQLLADGLAWGLDVDPAHGGLGGGLALDTKLARGAACAAGQGLPR